MNLRPALLAVAVLATLAACGKKEEAAAPAVATPAEAPAEAPAPTDYPAGLELGRFRGHAVMGKDGYGLTVCGDTRQLIVGFKPGAQAVLDDFLKGGAKEFYLDGWGTTDAQARPQFDRIERIYTEGPGCDEKDLGLSLFRARGNEPFWAVDVGPTGVKLERPDQPELVVEYQPLEQLPDGGRKFAADTAEGRFELVLTPGTCKDGMSDTVYGWNASLKLGTNEMKGCAFAGLMSE
jgi:putative lipoprotein